MMCDFVWLACVCTCARARARVRGRLGWEERVGWGLGQVEDLMGEFGLSLDQLAADQLVAPSLSDPMVFCVLRRLRAG